jgi:hypothetical protein
VCRQEEYCEIKKENNPAYSGMSAGFTFVGQLQTEFAVLVGQFPVLTYQVMVHVPALIVHTLQKF